MVYKKYFFLWLLLFFVLSGATAIAVAQQIALESVSSEATPADKKIGALGSFKLLKPPSLSPYFDEQQGASSTDLVSRALSANIELQAARLEIERSRARLTQAKLRANPALDFEQTTGRLTGSRGERETSLSFSLPLEIGGKRKSRVDLAQVEIAIAEAGVAERERQLASEVRSAYAEALAFLRELQITESLNTIDTQSVRVIEARVTEGDASPLELNLFRVEIDRLKSRRALLEGRLQAALLKLKVLAGVPAAETLRLREDLTAIFPEPALPVQEAVTLALQNRSDARLARLLEEAAQAGLKVAKAQGTPDVTAFSKYSFGSSVFDDTPVGILRDKDKLITFGVSISLPLFNRNQGAKAEAQIAIEQARRRREFVESLVRSEVAQSYARYEATKNALAIFETGVIERSTQNILGIRKAYELGAFSVAELLSEQKKFLDSQREFIEALAERYRALAEIQSAVGQNTRK
jgi:outer membrane protein, heavy metal efflux system